MYQLNRKLDNPNYNYETEALALTGPLIANNYQKMRESSCPPTNTHTQARVS